MRRIIAIVGPSGSGKTTLSNALKSNHGINPILSSTTRARRSPDDNDHTFRPEHEGEMAANDELGPGRRVLCYGYLYGTHYWIDESHIGDDEVKTYTVNPDALQMLFNTVGRMSVFVVFLNASEGERYVRLYHRAYLQDEAAKNRSMQRQREERVAFSSSPADFIINTEYTTPEKAAEIIAEAAYRYFDI